MPRDRKSDEEIDVKVIEILVCPLTGAALHHDRNRRELVSRAARLAFPIRGGVAIMLPSEARQLDDEEMAKIS